MIRIYGLTQKLVDKATAWFEMDYWYNTLWADEMGQDIVSVELNENCVIKVWKDEVMIDFFGKKVNIAKNDFREIVIE